MTKLADFLGDWRVDREISNADGEETRFEGFARFEGSSSKANYTERGQLRLANGVALQAERRYLWEEIDGQVRIFFEDGRHFHDLPEIGEIAHHFCDPDTYDLTYDFAAWPEWQVTWRVQGPKKDYFAVTCYRKLPN